MLPGRRRIRRAEDFRAVMRAGDRAAAGTLVVHARVTDPEQPSRVGFVVGRSVGGAVVRNRLTRQLRHLMAQHLTSMPEGMDVVVRVLPAAAQAGADQTARDLSSGLRRVTAKVGHQPRTAVGMSQ